LNYIQRMGAVLGATALVAGSQAALVFNLNTTYTGTAPAGTAPWARLTVTNVAANKVNVKFEHLSTSAESRFITSLYLNLSPFISNLAIVSGTEVNGNKRDGFTVSNNGVNGAAGNNFDVGVGFKTSNSGGGVNRLKQGEFWSADLTGTGLSALTFATANNKGNFIGAHIQGLNGGQSGHITTTGQPVPEPASLAALGMGAVALLRRRKKA